MPAGVFTVAAAVEVPGPSLPDEDGTRWQLASARTASTRADLFIQFLVFDFAVEQRRGTRAGLAGALPFGHGLRVLAQLP